MKKALLYIPLLLLFVITPIYAQSNRELKKENEQKEYIKIKKIIESGIYTFMGASANTQRGKRIDLTTNFNFLKINNSRAIADLPFFGFSQVSSFKGDGSIVFDINNADYKIEYDDKKHKIVVKFTAINKSEIFNLYLTIFPNSTASLNVSSSQRDFMNYRGNVKAVSVEK